MKRFHKSRFFTLVGNRISINSSVIKGFRGMENAKVNENAKETGDIPKRGNSTFESLRAAVGTNKRIYFGPRWFRSAAACSC